MLEGDEEQKQTQDKDKQTVAAAEEGEATELVGYMK